MKRINILIFLFLAFGVYCCQDIFEDDISGEEMILMAPADGLVTDSFEHTFWWEPVKGATGYEFQLVSPSFDFVRKFILDTNLTSEIFEYSLYPDTFQWAVRAFNGSSSTAYYYSTLIIDSSNVIRDVSLVSPLPNYITNDSIIQFKWREHIFANYYSIEILLDDDIFAVETVRDRVTYTLPNSNYPEIIEGNYRWKITAFNSNSNGSSEYRSFMIDWTSPGKPILLSPVSNDTVNQPTLSWKHPLTTGSQIFDSLFIYADTITNSPLTHYLSDTAFSFDGEQGVYFWKVKSVDAAGNEGLFSETRKFIIGNEK